MSPRCGKPKCLKRIPVYIPVHRPCLDSLHLPISRPCVLPSFNVQSSYIQQTHPACHCRDQSCSVKICDPSNDWIPTRSHICKVLDNNGDINTGGSKINQEKSEQYIRLESNNLDDEFVQEITQINNREKYFEEENENVNEVETLSITSQLSLSSTDKQISNIQDGFTKGQQLPKMPINSGQRKSKTSAARIRNNRVDSRSNVRHVGSTVVPETCSKGIQVMPSSTLHEAGFFPQSQLNNTPNLSRNQFVYEHANNQEHYSDATNNNVNRRESVIETDNFNQPKENREDFHNVRNETLNPCCQSKYVQTKQRNSDLLNNRSVNNNTDNPRQNNVYPERNYEYDREEVFFRPRDIYGSGTSRPSTNSPREHNSMNKSTGEYTSAQHLMKANDTKRVTSHVSPAKFEEFGDIQTSFDQVQNESEGYILNGKTYRRERNDSSYLNDLLSNEKGSRERERDSRDVDKDIPNLSNQTQNVPQEESCCKESAPEQNKPVRFTPMMNSGVQKQKLQRKDTLFSDTLTSGYRQGKSCCNHGISGLENKFRTDMEHDMSLEHTLGKFSTKNVDCACTDEIEEKDLKCTKKTCDRDVGTISCASVACSANQGTKCRCRYPPFFKQYTCAGNINGTCNCDD